MIMNRCQGTYIDTVARVYRVDLLKCADVGPDLRGIGCGGLHCLRWSLPWIRIPMHLLAAHDGGFRLGFSDTSGLRPQYATTSTDAGRGVKRDDRFVLVRICRSSRAGSLGSMQMVRAVNGRHRRDRLIGAFFFAKKGRLRVSKGLNDMVLGVRG